MTGDRGSATVLGAVAIAALVLTATLVMAVGTAEIARHRAAGAADLAVLAAAAAAADGSDEEHACARARWVADNMTVHLDRCWFDGADALVEVSAEPGGPLTGRVHAHARAGPVQLTADERPVAHPATAPNARATVAPAR
ncbi:Rv3654c family TadE-like protein [Labedaea rhizosphaerae]|uniref:Secretion/DNA translocation related TadE-like protein n=1 Tax=Labedaea rhizosphaerae TaxID=598644 RepID=A0A4R6SLK9_LABRH|nr:Rv3654c family TadE-like protein [Labedaea rhizosphaerae]TDQ04741.1 secretion/DNA translocation related TadE-like protein [Labedaea rhizosphaerae]